MKYLVLFGLPFLLALVLTPAVIRLNSRWGLVDLPDERRRLHERPVATSGGVAVILAYLISLAVNHWLFGDQFGAVTSLSWGLAVGLLGLGLLGLIDDKYDLGPWIKLAGQVAGGVVLYYFGFRIEAVTWPFGGQLDTGWLALPATVFWVVLICNAINLIDGVDGLAAGIAVVSLATLIAVSLRAGEQRVLFYAGMMAGAVAGFYRYNFPPARVFLGDTGSLALGLGLAAISLLENRKGTTALSLLVPIVAMGLPILDAGLAFLRRSRNGVSPFVGDRGHLHHRLLRLGLGPRQVVLLFIYATIYLGFTATLMALLPKTYVFLMIVILAVGLVVAMEALRFLEDKLNRPPDSE